MKDRKNLTKCSIDTLKTVGLKSGDIVLDCCCGYGYYTVAASKIVGKNGFVYAIDNDQERLNELQKEVNSNLYSNIKIIKENVEEEISINNNSVNFVLLYDIFWYFPPQSNNLSTLLLEIYRVTALNGIISVFPTHIDSHQLKKLQDKMIIAGFCLARKLKSRLVHDRGIEKGEILNYRK